MSRTPFVRPVAFLLTTATAGLLAGCSDAPDPHPLPATPATSDLLSRLEAETGTSWDKTTALDGITPRTLVPLGAAKLPGADPVARDRGFFARYATELGGEPGRLAHGDVQERADGSVTVRFRHDIPGTHLPILDTASAIHTFSGDEVAFVESGFGFDTSHTAKEPAISRREADDSAQAAVASECGATPGPPLAVELGGAIDAPGSVRLVFREDFAATGRCVAPRVSVDAVTGRADSVLDRAPSLVDRSKGGRFHYWDDSTDEKTFDVTEAVGPTGTPGGYYLATGGPPPTVSTYNYGSKQPIYSLWLGAWDKLDQGLSVDAHAHAIRALEHFRAMHSWRGVDGKGSSLKVVVHDSTMPHTGFYDPVEKSVHFGDGATVRVLKPNATFQTVTTLPLQLSYDGVVHELAHGIALASNGIPYAGEGAALHESFADVMGAAAKLLDPNGVNKTLDFAELSMAGRVGGRSLLFPERDGSIASYAKRPWCLFGTMLNDHCFAHATAGIGNRAFAMMVSGGSETTTDGRTVGIPGTIEVSVASRIWFDSFTRLAQGQARFGDLALAQTKLAARYDLHTLASVACAWIAVDVLSPSVENLWGLTCRSPRIVSKTSTCAGVPDGAWICNDFAPSSATQCRGGVVAAGTSCKNAKHRCVQASPSNFMASLNADGTLVCR
jgi:Zn-dependent metalloprotease